MTNKLSQYRNENSNRYQNDIETLSERPSDFEGV